MSGKPLSWATIPLLAGLLIACTTPSTALPEPENFLPSPTVGTFFEEAAAESLPDTPTKDPYGLAYVREEEKVAHDVYQFLYDQWGVQVFKNISSSEATHTNTIKTLLESYGMADPAAGMDPGQFTNPELQALYDQFTQQGSQSADEALKVGAAIEEFDILDLQSRLEGELPEDIRTAYEKLLSGSYNHLEAFTSALFKQTGEAYSPQILTWEAYQEALRQASSGGLGGGNGQGSGRP